MESTIAKLSEEYLEQFQSASGNGNFVSDTSVQILAPSKSPRSQESHHGKHESSKGNPMNHDQNSHSEKMGIYEKVNSHYALYKAAAGGSDGKGILGGLLDTGDGFLDPNDPNNDFSEGDDQSNTGEVQKLFADYKKKATVIVEEYFATDDVVATANELKELDMPRYNFYFLKKLVSMAMDRCDKEKEMAAVLLSTLYSNVIDPPQVYKGFSKLVESTDDLVVDIPDAVDILAVFVARAVVDDILPPAFLNKQMESIPKESKGGEVITRADKVYLSAPLHIEIVERKWGGGKDKTVDDVKAKINDLLKEYVVSGDKAEAFRCIKDLKVPFFHHEIVKRVLIMAMEKLKSEDMLLDLLKETAEQGIINSSQMTKGFSRLIDGIDDLSLDILSAKEILRSYISKAASEGWLCASSLKPISLQQENRVEEDAARQFKIQVHSIIQEYFLSGDILEVIEGLQLENKSCSPELNAIFVKKLITMAMDRKNREKEMASVLLSSLCFSVDDFVHGFLMLIEAAADTALDIPTVVDDLAMFLARAVTDEVISPQHLEEIGSQCTGQGALGSKVLKLAQSMLGARLSGERILRCWGGGGSSKPVWAIEDVKDKIGKLLEEYESGGELQEAFRCIKELGMPFFHHEVVKKALVAVMEKKNERLWNLLAECYTVGLITPNQMTKGFSRVAKSLEDLALDVPDVEKQFDHYVSKAKALGWLESSFSVNTPVYAVEN
ncbi:hypothetical protein Syun_019581 [Stephania yunnanensis]|uniref:MI domain-containing protein n=1 Tax=Stephania yunnanensis TaxID=152371 RepID=A0AAP0IUG3_9MAGN